jgi:hypothetical protein
MSYELYHHGIKGQRWGIRRFQKKDGSLTAAGKKRYDDTPELNRQKSDMRSARATYKSSRDAYDKAVSRYQNFSTSKRKVEMEKARSQYMTDRLAYRRSKLKYDTNREAARIQDKGIEIKKKSKHRLQLEEQYKKLGMTDEQAQAAANKRIRTEKILVASAALTVTACATYIALKARKDRIDGIIKAGEDLQRIEMKDTGGKLHDVFYVAKGEKDMRRYENLLGYTRKQQTGEAYLMKLSAQNDVKVASMDRCRKTFQDLYKNDADFKRSVDFHAPGIGALSKKKQYDLYNRALVNMHDTDGSKKFYDKLKKAGYGAIQDVNDMKYSGYHAKNPLIVFDNSNKNILVRSVSEMKDVSGKRAGMELLKATGETLADDFMRKAGAASAVGLTGAAAYTYISDPSKQYNTQGGTSKWS